MNYSITVAVAFLPALALGILALIATINAQKSFLPTSTSMQILAIILPFLNYAAFLSVARISSRPTLRLTSKASFASRVRSTLPSRETVTTVLFILDTLLITLTSSALSTQTLTCGLESRWQQLFIAKDENTIRAIQDRFECCGFRSVKDKAWPFPGTGVSAKACVERYGWERSCEGHWTAEGRSVLGMIIGVGLGVVVLKIIFLFAVRHRPEWFHGERGQSVFGRLSEGRIVGEEGEDEEGRESGRFLDEPERASSGDRMANGLEQGDRFSRTV